MGYYLTTSTSMGAISSVGVKNKNGFSIIRPETYRRIFDHVVQSQRYKDLPFGSLTDDYDRRAKTLKEAKAKYLNSFRKEELVYEAILSSCVASDYNFSIRETALDANNPDVVAGLFRCFLEGTNNFDVDTGPGAVSFFKQLSLVEGFFSSAHKGSTFFTLALSSIKDIEINPDGIEVKLIDKSSFVLLRDRYRLPGDYTSWNFKNGTTRL